MKFVYLFVALLVFSNMSGQKPDTPQKVYLLDSLEDKYLYRIDITIEKSFSKDTYHFMIGRAQRGFYVFGSNKRINKLCNDTTRLRYHRQLLEKSQIDSLKNFEQKLIARSNANCETPRQNFLLSNQAKAQNYLVKQSDVWNPVDELLHILFRQNEYDESLLKFL